MDIEKDPIHRKLKNALNYAQKNKYPVLILSDLNGHSPCWHSKDSNARGLEQEREFFQKRNLHVLNRAEQGPTFYSRVWGTSTNIDVSLCSPELKDYIKNHTHRDFCPASDHVGIDMTLCLAEDVDAPYHFNYRAVRKGDWGKWNEALANLPRNQNWPSEKPENWTLEIATEQLKYLHEDILTANNLVIKKVKDKPLSIDPEAKGGLWWNKQCEQKYKRMRSIRSYLRRLERQPLIHGYKPRCTGEDYAKACTAYWAEVNKAKRKGLQKYEGSKYSTLTWQD